MHDALLLSPLWLSTPNQGHFSPSGPCLGVDPLTASFAHLGRLHLGNRLLPRASASHVGRTNAGIPFERALGVNSDLAWIRPRLMGTKLASDNLLPVFHSSTCPQTL